MLNDKNLINILNEKKYNYSLHKHSSLFSVEESKLYRGKIKGAHTKNLFLKNKKNDFFLISCEEEDLINLKEISKGLNLGNLSFAKEEYLTKYLGVKPGSVSPYALLNDVKNHVNFYLEKKIIDSDLVNFHPLVNDLTVTMETKNFINFMIENKKKINIFSSSEVKLLEIYE